MTEHMEFSEIGKVVYDYSLKQFALLVDVYREHKSDVWQYTLEYVDGKKRDRFYSEILIKPVFHCIVEG